MRETGPGRRVVRGDPYLHMRTVSLGPTPPPPTLGVVLGPRSGSTSSHWGVDCAHTRVGRGGEGGGGGGGRLAQSPEACSRCGALHRLAVAVGRREATAIMDGSQRGGGGGGARPADREGGPRL